MFKVKKLDAERGDVFFVALNKQNARDMNINLDDRVEIFWKSGSFTAVLELCDSSILPGELGLFRETWEKYDGKIPEEVHVKPFVKPSSVQYIKRRLLGMPLKRNEIEEIVYDLMKNRLSSVEAAYFVASAFVQRLSPEEEDSLTRAMVNVGKVIKFKQKPILDKHCIGGVPGNRTTPIIVPIVAAAGYWVPKTSSRAITSPAGTADVLEILCNVSYSAKEMKRLVNDVGAAMIWGGSVNLAPVDDILLKLRYPLRLDPPSLLLASIVAKKKAAGADKVLIDIPLGAKVKDIGAARDLAQRFKRLGTSLKMEMRAIITDGYQPIGHGVGPSPEAIDILNVFRGKGPLDLKEKSLRLAGEMLDMAGESNGYKLATKLLNKGKAYKKFKEIVAAQEGNPNIKASDIVLGKYTVDVVAPEGTLQIAYDSNVVASLARIAGSPSIKGSGLRLIKLPGSKVKSGQTVIKIYTPVNTRIEAIKDYLKKNNPLSSRNTVIEVV
ncbi:MAG: thymidine phosphorylase [Candidatus Altiarchaeota archaeon]|nr:thymidine phosphorylase [Candidatus Altiarchaeota archaeon]